MNIRFFSFFLAGFIMLVFQAHPLFPFSKSGIRPDLVLCFILFISIFLPLCRGAFICFVVVSCYEILSGVNGGLFLVIYLSAFFIIRAAKKFFSFDAPVNLFSLLFLCLAVKYVILYFSFYWIYEYGRFDFESIVFREAVFSVCFFPFVFYGLKKIYTNQKDILKPHHRLKNGSRF